MWSSRARWPRGEAAAVHPLGGGIAGRFHGVDIFAQQIVFGSVLILAVAITIDRSKIPIVK